MSSTTAVPNDNNTSKKQKKVKNTIAVPNDNNAPQKQKKVKNAKTEENKTVENNKMESEKEPLYILCWERTDTGVKGSGKAFKYKDLEHWVNHTGADGNLKFTLELVPPVENVPPPVENVPPPVENVPPPVENVPPPAEEDEK